MSHALPAIRMDDPDMTGLTHDQGLAAACRHDHFPPWQWCAPRFLKVSQGTDMMHLDAFL